MALYHKWDVKNDFAFVLQFYSLISDSLGGVGRFCMILLQLPTDGEPSNRLQLFGCHSMYSCIQIYHKKPIKQIWKYNKESIKGTSKDKNVVSRK